MEFWMIFILVSVVSVFLEALIQKVIFINLSFAAIITAIISIFWGNPVNLSLILLGLFLVFCLVLRPILKRLLKINSPYIYKIAKVVETVSNSQGKIFIDDKTFEARTEEGEDEIMSESEVKIIKADNDIFYVKKV